MSFRGNDATAEAGNKRASSHQRVCTGIHQQAQSGVSGRTFVIHTLMLVRYVVSPVEILYEQPTAGAARHVIGESIHCNAHTTQHVASLVAP